MLSMESIAHSERPLDQIGCRDRLCANNVEYGAVARRDASSHDTQAKIRKVRGERYNVQRAQTGLKILGFRDDAFEPLLPLRALCAQQLSGAYARLGSLTGVFATTPPSAY